MPNKIRIEATLISARGLRRSSSSLWKRHWFAVGWIDPAAKYCTTVSKDGSATPTWKTKFAAPVDESRLDSAALTVEVYSREPIFLRETLEGTATVLLKEFVLKYYGSKDKGSSGSGDEIGSYQLRKRNSNRSRGLVDVSIRVTDLESGDSDSSSYPGGDEGIVLNQAPFQHPQMNPASTSGFTHQMPYPAYHHPIPNPSAGGSSYLPTMPPPSHPNVGYTPAFLPNSEYVNMPASAHGRWPARPAAGNLAVGAGVGGALAAGAMIYGDDFVSAVSSSIPSQTLQVPSLASTISLDPPFL